jgi:xanthine dehydrogenase accessory factor
MRQVFEFIQAEIVAGRPVVSAVIVSSTGSTPRGTGTRMALAKDGRSKGSVGGGPAEAMVQKKGWQVLDTGQSALLRIDLKNRDAAGEGMICGGSQEILVDFIDPGGENQKLFAELLAEWGQGAQLLTVWKRGKQDIELLSRAPEPSSLPRDLPESLIQETIKSMHNSRQPFVCETEGYSLLVEAMRSPGRVIIAGGGHVGRSTANLADYVGFEITVLDDRPEFLKQHNFPREANLVQVEGFGSCLDRIAPDRDCYIVILTRGHMHDKTVLAQALKTPAAYIGMIGSRKKRQAIYRALLEQGFSQTDLDRVHCPIGLSIDADTPREIGVSIVAELIQERAGD